MSVKPSFTVDDKQHFYIHFIGFAFRDDLLLSKWESNVMYDVIKADLTRDDISKDDVIIDSDNEELWKAEMMSWKPEMHSFIRTAITKSVNSSKSTLTKDQLSHFR